MTRTPILALAATLFLSGCATLKNLGPKPPAPPRKVISMRQQALIDQTFYKAVDAYMRGDFADCRILLGDIFRLNPFDRNALQLRQRVDAVERVAAAAAGSR